MSMLGEEKKGIYMKLTGIAISFIAIAFTPQLSFSFQGGGCGQDCASCHSLSKKEAGDILKIDVSGVSQAPAKGLWEVEGSQNGKKVKVYLDYGKKYAVVINAFIPVEQIGKPPALKKLDIKSIPLSDAVRIGDPSAKNKILLRQLKI